jgi:hypothetical protein
MHRQKRCHRTNSLLCQERNVVMSTGRVAWVAWVRQPCQARAGDQVLSVQLADRGLYHRRYSCFMVFAVSSAEPGKTTLAHKPAQKGPAADTELHMVC